MAGKREDAITWDEYFMSMTALTALRSNSETEGACLVDSEKRILSLGSYNVPYTLQNKIAGGIQNYVLRPVANTLFTFKGRRAEFEGGTLYLSEFPNPEDARSLARARLQKVVYLTNGVDLVEKEISSMILEHGKVEAVPYFDDQYSKREYYEFLHKLKEIVKKHIRKEHGLLTAEEYFMTIASLSALRSKDPSTQVGSCMVDPATGQVLSVGYNGASYGFPDDLLPWDSRGEAYGDRIQTKNDYIDHAELNCADNYRGEQKELQGKDFYVTFSPCKRCTERLSLLELNRVVWLHFYQKDNVQEVYRDWFGRTHTHYGPYYDERTFTKGDCQAFFQDATQLIKTNLKRS